MHVVPAGPAGRQPLVLLEAGSTGFSADWAVVQARLAERGLRSLAYDRAGLGLSEPGPAPRDGLAIVGDLEKLLEASGERGPLILVGHSMAGLHICLFAGRNRARVAGLVLVDAITPAMAGDPRVQRSAVHYGRLLRATAALARAGLMKPLAALGDTIGLDDEAKAHKRWAFGDAGHNAVSAEEVVHWETAVAQALAAGPLDPAWPLAVVTAGAARGQARLKILQTQPIRDAGGGHVDHVPGAGHASLVGRRFADRVVAAIEQVLKARAA